MVAEVSDHDPTVLRYLGELGLYPSVKVIVTNVAPFNGPLTVLVGGAEYALGHKVTNQILVARASIEG